MNRRYKSVRKTDRIKEIILSHIEKDIKEYILVFLIFIIGIILGVIFINNISEDKKVEITTYITSIINELKEGNQANETRMLFNSIKENTLFAVILWIAGSTVIGIPIIYLIIFFRGFCLGYTISSVIISLGRLKGLGFCLSSLFLQNMFFIPAMAILAVSGINTYRFITNNKVRESIKMVILRHFLCFLLSMICLIISSIIEVYVSKILLKIFIKYI